MGFKPVFVVQASRLHSLKDAGGTPAPQFKKLFWLALAAAILVLSLAGTVAVPEIGLFPRDADGGTRVGQGKVFAVAVADPDREFTVAAAHWGGQTVPCLYDEGRGRWLGIGGVDRETAPGGYEVAVIMTLLDGRRLLVRREIEVLETKFSSGRLTVDPDMIDVPSDKEEWVEEDRAAFEGAKRRGSLTRWEAEEFLRPVGGAVTSPFGRRRTYNNSYKSVHTGVDFKAAVGSAVRAAGAGVVVLVREAYITGHTVVVDHGGGVYTSYSHLGEFAVTEGREVAKGDVVGKIGLTGRITGPHLHFGCTVQGTAVDPLSLLELSRLF